MSGKIGLALFFTSSVKARHFIKLKPVLSRPKGGVLNKYDILQNHQAVICFHIALYEALFIKLARACAHIRICIMTLGNDASGVTCREGYICSERESK
jgi:hypothetical protein